METTVYRPSRESQTRDSDQSESRPSTASYIRARAARADISDDPAPLFLSDPLGIPDPREYAPLALRSRKRLVPRALALVAAVTAASLAALFQSDLRNLLTANADATTAQAASPASLQAARQTPIKDPARVTGARLAGADAQTPPAPPLPSREAIATAYQVALQAQVPTTAPMPVAAQKASSAPARALDADTLAGLMTRARSLINVGDIVAARLLLERAANANDATAALLLAQTYDPVVLGTSDARSIIADASAARDWYRRAATLGSAEAQQRLARSSN